MRQLLSKNLIFFVPYFILLAGCLLLQGIYGSPLITLFINHEHNSFFDPVSVFFTDLGDGNTTVALTLVLLFISYGRALVFLVITNLSGLLDQIVKYLINSPRPQRYFDPAKVTLHFVDGVRVYHDHSFPSGHTTTAFSMAVIACLFLKQKTPGFIFLLLAIGVAWSRIYLGEHFFADVIAGSVLGSVTSLIGYWYFIHRTKLPEASWYEGNLITFLRRSRPA